MRKEKFNLVPKPIINYLILIRLAIHTNTARNNMSSKISLASSAFVRRSLWEEFVVEGDNLTDRTMIGHVSFILYCSTYCRPTHKSTIHLHVLKHSTFEIIPIFFLLERISSRSAYILKNILIIFVYLKITIATVQKSQTI